MFHFLSFFLFNKYVSCIQLSWVTELPIFGKSCHLCLPSIAFVGAKLYLHFIWCWGLDVDLFVSVPEFTYLLSMKRDLRTYAKCVDSDMLRIYRNARRFPSICMFKTHVSTLHGSIQRFCIGKKKKKKKCANAQKMSGKI